MHWEKLHPSELVLPREIKRLHARGMAAHVCATIIMERRSGHGAAASVFFAPAVFAGQEVKGSLLCQGNCVRRSSVARAQGSSRAAAAAATAAAAAGGGWHSTCLPAPHQM